MRQPQTRGAGGGRQQGKDAAAPEAGDDDVQPPVRLRAPRNAR